MSKEGEKFGRNLGNSITQVARAIASWVGLDSVFDSVSEAIGGASNDNSKIANYLNSEISKLADQYQLDISDIYERLSNIRGIPDSWVTRKAKRKERKRLRESRLSKEKEYLNKSRSLQTSLDKVNSMREQNKTAQNILHRTAYDGDNNISNAIRRIEEDSKL